MKLNLAKLDCTLISYLIFLCSTVFFISPLIAQTDSKGQELKGVQKQIEDLREGQKQIQKELQEIKTLIQGRAAPPNLPPQNLTVSLGNKPVKGDKNAKLTLVEFSDYQCPFCSRSFRETLPQIEKEYVLTGKLKYILRDFPIESIHKDAFRQPRQPTVRGSRESTGRCMTDYFRTRISLVWQSCRNTRRPLV